MLTEEARRKLSESHIGAKNPMYGKPSWNKGKKYSEETRRKLKEKRKYQQIPKKDTQPEKMIQNALTLEGIKFLKHKPFKVGNTYHPVDIFIEPNLCVEVDGVYFHSLPKSIQRDREIDNELKSNGYEVIRFPVNKTKDFDVQSAVKKIKFHLFQND